MLEYIVFKPYEETIQNQTQSKTNSAYLNKFDQAKKHISPKKQKYFPNYKDRDYNLRESLILQ